VAFTVYRLRKKGFRSLPDAINERYGSLATVVYALVVLYRLEQEVWSNALVVADFYGGNHDEQWWLAALVASGIPCIYILFSGLKSSINTDIVQAVIALVFLILIVSVVSARLSELDMPGCHDGNRSGCNVLTHNPVPDRARFSLAGGLDLATVGLLQGFTSYGFFDPVLTDRAFLLQPDTMWYAYLIGGFIAALFIVFFSSLGVYGNIVATYGTDVDADVEAGQPAAVAEYLGPAWFSIVNIIFITSSISTVDSTFTSTSKIVGPELYEFVTGGKPKGVNNATELHMTIGRWAVVAMLVLGLVPLLNEDITALSATTSTGTLLMGMGPPILFLCDIEGYRPLCFHIPFFACACLGVVYMMTKTTNELNTAVLVDITALSIGDGGYALLLGVNVWSCVLAFGSFFLFTMENRMGEDVKRHVITDGPGLHRLAASLSGDIALVYLTDSDRARLAERQHDEEEDDTHEYVVQPSFKTLVSLPEEEEKEKETQEEDGWGFFGLF
jgi:hypothetical protein